MMTDLLNKEPDWDVEEDYLPPFPTNQLAVIG